MKTAGQKSRVQCLDRTMDILEALARKNEMGVTEIARELGLHVATIHNILSTLTARHYLLNTAGHYRLGPGLSFLSSRWNPVVALSALAQPRLEEITRRTRESAVATALVGSRAVMFAHTLSLDDVTVQFAQPVCLFPMFLATGRLLIAFLPEEYWPMHISRHIDEGPKGGPETGWTKQRWREELRRIRARGICVLSRPGHTNAMGVPVYGPGGSVLAALGVACPHFRSTAAHQRAMRAAMTDMAHQLSMELGHEGSASQRNVNWKSQNGD